MANKISTPRQKALKKNFIFGLVVLIIGIVAAPAALVLFNIANSPDGTEVLSVLALVCIALAGGGIVGGGYALFFESKRIRRSYCENCGEKLDYETDVAWELRDEVISSTNETAKKEAIVEFETKCHKCGHEKNFTQKFVTGRVDKDGKVTHTNLNKSCRKYFAK